MLEPNTGLHKIYMDFCYANRMDYMADILLCFCVIYRRCAHAFYKTDGTLNHNGLPV